MGRFVTPDPVGFSDGPNLYAYVHNSPMVLVDPYGLTAVEGEEDGEDWTRSNALNVVPELFFHKQLSLNKISPKLSKSGLVLQ